MIKRKSKVIKVHADFYDRVERERKKFMKKHKLTRLTTTAFTGIMDAKLINEKKIRQKRRR